MARAGCGLMPLPALAFFMRFIMVFFVIIFGSSFIFFTVIFLNYIKAFKIKPEVLISITGSMGSGKTLFGSSYSFVVRSKKRLSLAFKRFKSYLFFWKKKLNKNGKVYVYSNIPLYSKYYLPLDTEHLLRKKPMFQHCVIFIDEFGAFCNQYDWSNPYVIEQLTDFFRFARHWLDATIIITDQNSDSIPKQVRDRISTEYHLARCRTWCFKWKKCDVYPVQHITEDTKNVVNVQNDKVPYMIKYLSKHPLYDSRCYSETYYKGFVFDRTLDDSTGLKTRYLLDFEPNVEFLKKYKSDKRDAKHSVLEAPLDSQN